MDANNDKPKLNKVGQNLSDFRFHGLVFLGFLSALRDGLPVVARSRDDYNPGPDSPTRTRFTSPAR